MHARNFVAGLFAFTTAFGASAADWQDFSVGRIGKLQYDAQSYQRKPGDARATLDVRDLPSKPGRLQNGREYTSMQTRLVVDCDRREYGAVEIRYLDNTGQVVWKFERPTPQNPTFIKPSIGNMERFVVAICQQELLGVDIPSAPRRWIHYLENERGALYFDSKGLRSKGAYEAVYVRLYYLGGAQLPNGAKIDLSEATWVIDCRSKQGAVTTERKIRVEGGQGQVVASMSTDLSQVSFTVPQPGTLPALFTESLCAGQLSQYRQ